jgi:anti-sigma28 factor (negative regulator of flagellin synthesis)
MRILDRWLSKTLPSRAESTRGIKKHSSAGSSQVGSPATPVASDTVATLNQGKLVSQALAADSVERSDRIQQLKATFESGNYQVDAADLSRALVADALANKG